LKKGRLESCSQRRLLNDTMRGPVWILWFAVLASLVAVPAHGACPAALPPSVVAAVTDPSLRASATFDPQALISAAGSANAGLALLRKDVEEKESWLAEARRSISDPSVRNAVSLMEQALLVSRASMDIMRCWAGEVGDREAFPSPTRARSSPPEPATLVRQLQERLLRSEVDSIESEPRNSQPRSRRANTPIPAVPSRNVRATAPSTNGEVASLLDVGLSPGSQLSDFDTLVADITSPSPSATSPAQTSSSSFAGSSIEGFRERASSRGESALRRDQLESVGAVGLRTAVRFWDPDLLDSIEAADTWTGRVSQLGELVRHYGEARRGAGDPLQRSAFLTTTAAELLFAPARGAGQVAGWAFTRGATAIADNLPQAMNQAFSEVSAFGSRDASEIEKDNDFSLLGQRLAVSACGTLCAAAARGVQLVQGKWSDLRRVVGSQP
jgi:hypothetical protein